MDARGLAALALVGLAAACGARSSLVAPEAERGDPFCGDGLVDPGEACDDHNDVATDACVPGCLFARCGDGIVRAFVEACDDGNLVSGDGCTASCALPSCGNGIVEPGEVCDDGNGVDTDDCPSRCLPAICGDGFVHAGLEACDGGAANADSPAFLLLQGALARPVLPITRPMPLVSFYDYSSASAHTGFEEPGASKLFLYRDLAPGGLLGLVTIHGVDKNTSGQEQPPARVQMGFFGLPEGTFVAVVDDGKGEFSLLDPATAQGDWTFDNNTDGAALSGLPSPGAWVVDVVPGFLQGIERWEWVDESGETIVLDRTTTARIVALGAPSVCRLDCTIPRCGDGILDAGEVCDDGNVVSFDGCAADCRSTD